MSGIISIILSTMGHENFCKDDVMESAENLLDPWSGGRDKTFTWNIHLLVKTSYFAGMFCAWASSAAITPGTSQKKQPLYKWVQGREDGRVNGNTTTLKK